jgi:GntR family transcriptional regulator
VPEIVHAHCRPTHLLNSGGPANGPLPVRLAPPIVAEKLQTPSGEKVWVRRRTVRLEDRPHQLADSYYALDVVHGTLLMQEDSGPGGDFACLANAGHEPSQIEEEWTARMPTKPEAEALALPGATPVLELTRTIYDQSQRPVEVMLSVVDASAIRLDYRFSVPD